MMTWQVLWYFYFVNGSACYLVYTFLLSPVIGSTYQHYIYALAAVLMQLTYAQAHLSTPGLIETGKASREKYEAALQAAADGSLVDAGSMPALCHTCRIVKPLRSKHCSTAKRCVPMFDHYCPYINNTIGGANYLYFCRFIFFGLISAALSVLGGVQYILGVSHRNAIVWFYVIDMSLVTLMAILMNNYHLSLIVRNLTTNEDMNKHRCVHNASSPHLTPSHPSLPRATFPYSVPHATSAYSLPHTGAGRT